jgi:hypothetical protein
MKLRLPATAVGSRSPQSEAPTQCAAWFRLHWEARPERVGLSPNFNIWRYLNMSSARKAHPYRLRKTTKRVLLGETIAEEAARLEKEIAAHPVTRCEPGARNHSSSRPGWSSKPFIPLSEQMVAEGIAKKMMRKAKTKS